MGEESTNRVILDLLPGEPIRGRISAGANGAESFRGWIDLASKLEHLRTDGALQNPGSGEVHGP